MTMSSSDKNAAKRVEQLRTLLRDLFGIVHQDIDVVEMNNVVEMRIQKVAIISPWPLGIDKRQVDARIKPLGFELAPFDHDPYSSAYWL